VIDRLLKWMQIASTALLWLSMLAGLLMMLHVTADVIGRTFFNHPIAGTLEFASAYYMVAVAFLPWAWVAWNEGHIRVELFTRNLGPRKKAWLDVIVTVLTTVYLSLFTWQTCVRALQSTRAGEAWEAPNGFLSVWPSRWLLPLAGAFMTVYLILHVIAETARLLRRVDADAK
jgi:TRAP-type C4-dicarboxylate transport system permease small subunit